jgi:hypothetical protein
MLQATLDNIPQADGTGRCEVRRHSTQTNLCDDPEARRTPSAWKSSDMMRPGVCELDPEGGGEQTRLPLKGLGVQQPVVVNVEELHSAILTASLYTVTLHDSNGERQPQGAWLRCCMQATRRDHHGSRRRSAHSHTGRSSNADQPCATETQYPTR